MTKFSPFLVVVLLLGTSASPALSQMDPDTAASHFGQRDAVWGMRMSPDGQKVSFLRWHPDGFPIAMAMNFATGKANLVVASNARKQVDLTRCEWANNTRLLCSFYGIQPYQGDHYTMTRLVAVDMDGSKIEVLAQRQQRDELAFHQADVIDLLADDPKHILMPIVKDYGQGVSKVDIYRNKVKTVLKAKKSVWQYWSDGRGMPRIRYDMERTYSDFQVRLAEGGRWRPLHRRKPSDVMDAFYPVGFGDDPNTLYLQDRYEGRVAIFAEKLSEQGSERELVFAHPEADIDHFLRLGKFNRPVGVGYSTERPTVHYFDDGIRAVRERIGEELPEMLLSFIDESWDRRYYLVHGSSDVFGGSYYRFDSEQDELSLITVQHPWLKDEPLAPMEAVSYPSEDGRKIPGYVTQLASLPPGPKPAIILPHGGPAARDEWGYDWFVQYFASQGYVVLQANYRGSSGYGQDWQGEGAYRGWKQVMVDLEYGARYLVEQGIADPERICAVGWSYGGYAALMSAAEYPGRYRCVVSIAGVTDPADLVNDSWGHMRRFRKAQIGLDSAVIRDGAPKHRAADIQSPVLLVHAEKDINVGFDHGKAMHKALKNEKKSVKFVEYEDDDHQIRKQVNRIDMLQQVGTFLDGHLRSQTP